MSIVTAETIVIARAKLTAAASRRLIEALNSELSGAYSEPGATMNEPPSHALRWQSRPSRGPGRLAWRVRRLQIISRPLAG